MKIALERCYLLRMEECYERYGYKSDKKKVIAAAENGVPVTGAMVDEWCSAYDKGKLPKGYVTDGIETVGRPPLHLQRTESAHI